MNNFEKKFKRIVKKVKPNHKRKKEIYNQILYKNRKKHLYLKPVFASCVIILICVFGIAYADDIKKTFNTLKIKYIEKTEESNNLIKIKSDAIKELNYDADIPEASSESPEERKLGKLNNTYSYEELENLLGIKILQSKYFKKKELHQQETIKKNNKIAIAVFDINNFMNFKPNKKEKNGMKLEHFNMCFRIETKYAKKNQNSTGWYSNVESKEYYINNLDTTVLIVKIIPNYRVVRFDYDNIQYNFEFMFGIYHTENEINNRIIEILESLSYD